LRLNYKDSVESKFQIDPQYKLNEQMNEQDNRMARQRSFRREEEFDSYNDYSRSQY